MDFIWQSALDFVASHFYVSPFWYWLIVGAAVVAFFSALGWFFQFMRPIAGVVFVAIASALAGYRWAETDVANRQKAEEDRRQRQSGENGSWWKW